MEARKHICMFCKNSIDSEHVIKTLFQQYVKFPGDPSYKAKYKNLDHFDICEDCYELLTDSVATSMGGPTTAELLKKGYTFKEILEAFGSK